MTEKPRIIVKAKNIQLVLDYCLQEKTEFAVIPRNASNDEWEVELNIKSISKAIEWGMFIKANKLDYTFNDFFKQTEAPIIQKAKPKAKEKKTNVPNKTNDLLLNDNTQVKPTEQKNLLTFDMETENS